MNKYEVFELVAQCALDGAWEQMVDLLQENVDLDSAKEVAWNVLVELLRNAEVEFRFQEMPKASAKLLVLMFGSGKYATTFYVAVMEVYGGKAHLSAIAL